MRTILLTSNSLRHRFAITEVARRSRLLGVWQEDQPFNPLSTTDGNLNDLHMIEKHFAARDYSEERYFAKHVERHLRPAELFTRRVEAGNINLPGEIELMSSFEPDVVLVYGSGLLGRPLIERFVGRIINLHLGLSPYYRGSGTNFWPLVNREPEYVGVTIHFIDPGIDTGPIICHGRPEIQAGDGPHDIGCKTIIVGANLLIAAAERFYKSGRLHAVPQTSRGKLYQTKDFNAAAVRTLYENFEKGMIEEYLAAKEQRDARLHLVELPGDEAPR